MIVVNNPRYGHRIAEASGTVFNPAVDQCIARVEDGVICLGVTYQEYTGTSIHMHMAGLVPNRATRDFLWVAFDYPFNQLNCKKVFGKVAETNTKTLEIVQKLGFKIVAKIDDVFPDGACIVHALAREDCRWLNLKPRSLAARPER